MKKIMCFGTFDLLHLGHLHYFGQAKKQGDYLIVVIARDKTKQKQKKPVIFTEQERLTLVQNLRIVDEAVLGNPLDYFKIILKKKPDVICLGYDHMIQETELARILAKHRFFPQIVRITPYKAGVHKSSVLKNRIIQMY